MNTRDTQWLAWLCTLTLVACGDPPRDPTGLAPSFHRDGGGSRTVIVDRAGRHDATTIQAGIALAPEGGRVLVLPGTYTEALVIDKGLTLEGIGGKRQGRTVIASPPGLPTATIRIATANPVVMSDLTVLVRGQNGILAQGIFDVALRRLNMVFEEVPPTVASRLVRPENTASQTGGQARLIVRESFFDAQGLPGTLAISIAADVDAVIERNVLRRTGNACIFVNGSSEINVDIADNDLDECAMRGANSSAIEVGPIVGSTIQAMVGVVNIVGNRIRNSGASCPPHTAIRYELHTGRIERNSISGVVQECAVPSPLALPAAIWVGSLRGYAPASPVVRFNDIVGNAHAGLRVAPNITTSLDARCNWWGSATGPSGAGSGTGDGVLVETGGARPVLGPFATGPVAERRYAGAHDNHGGNRHSRESCRLDFSLWSAPVLLGAPLNSACQDQTPTLSRDELALYFMSNRQGGLGINTPDGCQDTNDLWLARRASRDSPWETPVNLGSPVNTSADEAGPALSPDGHLLFFTSNRDGGAGQNDLYMSRRAHREDVVGWGPPVSLGPDVNTTSWEAGPSYLARGEDGPATLYFYRGVDNNLTTDIHSVQLTRDGKTLGPAVPVSELNSPVQDNHASVRADGREILFNSRRPGGAAFDIWASTRPSVRDAWSAPENVGAPVNSQFAEFHPNLSFDGRTLLFIAGGARGGLGGFDIWMTTRTRIGHRER
jgi:WD40 repeat protein